MMDDKLWDTVIVNVDLIFNVVEIFKDNKEVLRALAFVFSGDDELLDYIGFVLTKKKRYELNYIKCFFLYLLLKLNMIKKLIIFMIMKKLMQ